MEEQAVIDQIASLRFDADDRRVSRLMLALVKRPRVVDLEIEVHRLGFLRLEAELEGDLLVRLDLLDRPESDDLHGSGDDGRDVLGRPVPLVRDVHLEAVPAVRLEPSVRRLEEQSRITVLQQSLDPRLRGHLGSLDEGLGPFQVLEAYRLFRLLQERLDVGEVRVDGVCGRHRVPAPFHVGARPVQDGPPALAGERFFRAPEVLVHLSRVLLLDCALDLREVRLRLPDIQVLALRDRDIVDQGRELDLDLLRGDLALLPFEGLVEALLDLPDALVLAFVVRLFRLPEEELGLARVRADPLHLADRVAGRDQDVAHAVSQLGLDQVRLRLRLFDELPRELDVRLQGRLGFGHEFVRLGRLGRAEGVDRHGGQRHRAVREGAHVRVRFRRDEHELLDHLVDAFELVQQPRPALEDVPVPVLDLLQDLEHVEGEELRLLPDDDRREERMRRAFDQDLRVPEIETFHADARARLERVFHEILHDREHAGEDVLVDLLAELAAVMRDEPSVGMDQEDVLDEIRRRRCDLDILRVSDLVAVLVEESLVRDPDGDRHRARALRLHADPDRDDLADADLRDRRDAFRLQVAGELDLDVSRRQLPAVLDLDDVLVPLPRLQAGRRQAERQVRILVLDEILDLDADRDFGLLDQDVRHRDVARAERGLRLLERTRRVAQLRPEAFCIGHHRRDGVDPGLVFVEEVGLARLLQGCAGVGESALEAVDVALLDRLPRPVQVRPGGFRRNPQALRLGDEFVEAVDLVHRPLDDLVSLRIEEPLLQVALEPVHLLEIVGGRRVLRVGAELVEFLLGETEGHAFLDHRRERADHGAEMRLASQVDFFGDPFRISANVVQFARVDHRLRPRQDLRGRSDVGAELRVGLDLRPELRQAVPRHPRLLIAAVLLDDVFDY